MKKLITIFILLFNIAYSKNCTVAPFILNYTINSNIDKLSYISDIKQNYKKLKHLCVNLLAFREGALRWKMLLVTNPKREHGVFWFLPHDNENSAFNSAVYAVSKYGGGFLAVVNNNKRYNAGQDPNRNFSYSRVKICKEQIAPSPIYTNIVFSIIDYYKGASMPYLALHNNTNGGGISILKSSSKVKSYLAYPKSQIIDGKGLQDEDNLVYMAGLQKTPPSSLYKLLKAGMSVKYEIVNSINNDCSMSNFVVLEKGTNNYFNIETQHRQSWVQKEMIDRVIKLIIEN
jgi:hypothetical protein